MSINIREVIKIKKLTNEQKLTKTGGSFYAIALGIGILVSTVSSLVCNIVSAAKGTNSASNELYSSLRRSTMMRLSPVPSRSSIMVF